MLLGQSIAGTTPDTRSIRTGIVYGDFAPCGNIILCFLNQAAEAGKFRLVVFVPAEGFANDFAGVGIAAGGDLGAHERIEMVTEVDIHEVILLERRDYVHFRHTVNGNGFAGSEKR
jgi:hypothetical protein